MTRTEFMTRLAALPFLGFLAPAEGETTLYTGRGGDGLDYGIPDEFRIHHLQGEDSIIDAKWAEPSRDIKADVVRIQESLGGGQYQGSEVEIIKDEHGYLKFHHKPSGVVWL